MQENKDQRNSEYGHFSRSVQGNLKKPPKLTYEVTHPGNKKLTVSLAISDKIATSAIKSYYPTRKDAANLLYILYIVLIIFQFTATV